MRTSYAQMVGSGDPGFSAAHIRQDRVFRLLAVAILFILMSVALSGVASADNPTTQFSRAEYLEQHGHREEARNVLADAVQANYDPAAIQRWLEFDEKWADELKAHSHNTEASSFTAQTTERADSAVTRFFVSGLLGDRVGPVAIAEMKREELISMEEAHPLPEVDIKEVKAIFDEFNCVKASESRLRQLLKSALKEGPEPRLSEYNALYKRHDELAASIIKTRTCYISFDVISPNLARAEQLVHLSDLKSPVIGHDKDTLAQAAKCISKVCDQNALLESDETVRDQFVRVFKAIKGMAGTEEFEDLKVLQTLCDSAATEQKKGAERWWDK